MHAPVLNVLNQSIRIHHEYPHDSIKDCQQLHDCFIREFECFVREYRFIAWNVNRTTGKEVRPWLDWPDRLLRP